VPVRGTSVACFFQRLGMYGLLVPEVPAPGELGLGKLLLLKSWTSVRRRRSDSYVRLPRASDAASSVKRQARYL
jgi:hypothetical protein